MHTFFGRIQKKMGSSGKILTVALVGAGGMAVVALIYFMSDSSLFKIEYDSAKAGGAQAAALAIAATTPPAPAPAVLDTVAYDKKMLQLANWPIVPTAPIATSTTTSTSTKAVATVPTIQHLWPVKPVYPKAGALLPFNRIVAYYGNFYSTSMGVLGEYPTDIMLQKLNAVVAQWTAADPTTPVIPAIDYIAVTAQGSPGADGKYRLRMPADQIQKAIALADQEHGIAILEIQPGDSTVETELPLIAPYLKLPEVHLALDPEFAMHDNTKPGTKIGTLDASDINWAANYLAGIVDANNLPPKVLIVHRFTEDMVTNYQLIKPLPDVQIVMDMDGWGSPEKKIGTYKLVISPDPVEFTGFKLFYKNDLLPPSTRMLTPAEILNLSPEPSFIQYQ